MKKIYSVILLFSFIVGVLQPVLPMAEFYISDKGELTELFDHGPSSMSCDDNKCMEMSNEKEMCTDCDHDSKQGKSLLDIDYYPIPIKMSGNTGITDLTAYSKQHPIISESVRVFYQNPNTPPPKVLG